MHPLSYVNGRPAFFHKHHARLTNIIVRNTGHMVRVEDVHLMINAQAAALVLFGSCYMSNLTVSHAGLACRCLTITPCKGS
jgi:hypothetical protein